MPQFRKLSSDAKGIMTNPRDNKGQYQDSGLLFTSGQTYGGQGDSLNYSLLPSIISGQTDYDPVASTTGSNLSAVQMMSNFQPTYYGSDIAIKSGLDGELPTGSSVGGVTY